MVYKNPGKRFKDSFDHLVSQSRRVLITSHKNPDDDSIGSVLSIYHILTEKYPEKEIQILYTGEMRTRWSYFENFDKIENTNDICNHFDQFDLVIFLDQNQYQMFTNCPKKLSSFNGKTIVIDHHASSPDRFDLSLYDPGATSATELVYNAFCKDSKEIHPRLAETLLLGILGDTGTLHFVSNTKADIFSVVQRLLLSAHTRIEDLKAKYRGYSWRVFTIIQEYVKNATVNTVDSWPEFLFSYIDRNFVNEGEYSDLEINEAAAVFISTFGVSLDDADWAFILVPLSNGNVKVELRAKSNSVNVRMIMEGMGVGGGHNKSSGGMFTPDNNRALNPPECKDTILQWLENNHPVYT